MSIDLKRFRGIFYGESLDGLAQAERDLLEIEKALGKGGGAPDEAMQSLFRAVHSVKGSAGSLGFTEIGELAHELEGVLDLLRRGAIPPAEVDIDLLFAGVDALRAMVLAARDDSGPVAASRIHALRSRLGAVAGGEGAMHDDDPDLPMQWDDPPEAQPAVGGAVTFSNQFRVVFKPFANFSDSGNDANRYVALLHGYGQATVSGDAVEGFVIDLATDASAATLRAEFDWVDDLCEVTVTPVALAPTRQVAAPKSPAASNAPVNSPANAQSGVQGNPQAAQHVPRHAAQHVPLQPEPSAIDSVAEAVADAARATALSRLSVSATQLDSLLEIAGSLITANAALQSTITDLHLHESPAVAANLASLNRHGRELRDVALAMRLTPANVLFAPFTRVVRDLARRLGKDVVLHLRGEGQELDKSLIEALADPLAHLVRNAIDHGLEMPMERDSSGKPQSASLTLALERSGGQVVLSVEDDGRGIDPAAVRRTAIAKGLAREDEAKTDQAWLEMVFASGFSTAQAVTDLSGRGVGLDAVYQAVTRLGGDLALLSVPGQGTRFSMRFPLTTAIADVLVLEQSGNTFVLPTDNVAACLQSQGQAVRDTWGYAIFDWQGEAIPCGRLGALYFGEAAQGAAGASTNTNAAREAEETIVVLRAGNRHAALVVERVLDNTQVVVKNLEKNLFPVPMVSGMTILGNGRLAPILDAQALTRRMAAMVPTSLTAAAPAVLSAAPPTLH
jgi:two-component system, chemotaxis family, sensor kinase CheA